MDASVIFTHLIQDSQDYGSDDEHMVSRAFFTLKVGDKTYPNLYADIKQTVGSSIESAPLEISRPAGYEGPFNHEKFRAAVEKYFRGQIGAAGRGIRIQGGANIRMRNNRFVATEAASFPVEAGNKAW
jgi:hypothetical protein